MFSIPLIFILSSPIETQQSILSGKEILQVALDQRRSITRAVLTVTSKSDFYDGKTPSGMMSHKLWLDGPRLRKDTLFLPKGLGSATTVCHECEKAGYYVVYMGPTAGSVRSVTLGKLGDDEEKKTVKLVDPRVFGLVFSSPEFLFKGRIDTVLSPMLVADSAVEKSKWKEYDCYLVRARFSGKVVTATVVPGLGYSVARLEEKTENGVYSYIVDSVFEYHERVKLWFPKMVTREFREEGKLTRRDVFEISIVSLNEPIPEDAFRLRGMDIPAGTRVIGPGLGSSHVWNGNQIVSVQQAKQMEPIIPVHTSVSGRRWLYVLLAGALLGLAYYAIILRRNQAAPSTSLPTDTTVPDHSGPDDRSPNHRPTIS